MNIVWSEDLLSTSSMQSTCNYFTAYRLKFMFSSYSISAFNTLHLMHLVKWVQICMHLMVINHWSFFLYLCAFLSVAVAVWQWQCSGGGIGIIKMHMEVLNNAIITEKCGTHIYKMFFFMMDKGGRKTTLLSIKHDVELTMRYFC